MAGWVSASRSRRARASLNTSSRRARRSRLPSGRRNRRPKCSARRARSGVPTAVTSRAMRSASMIGTPRAANRLAAVDLPHAMPPVRPTRKARGGKQVTPLSLTEQPEIARNELVAEQEHQPARGREERSERNGRTAILSLHCQYHDSGYGADRRGHQDDRQQHLPAEPSAERGEQLEVPVAHAFLAREQAEGVIDEPQAEIAGHRADEARAHVHGYWRTARLRAPEAQEETDPQEG